MPERFRVDRATLVFDTLMNHFVKVGGIAVITTGVCLSWIRVGKGGSREQGGTGLGLSLVKNIVQLHAGTVWAESRLGEATTFFLFSQLRTTGLPMIRLPGQT